MPRFARTPIVVAALATLLATAPLLTAADGAVAIRPPMPSYILVGFAGGFVRHDNPHHGPVQLAQRIQLGNPKGVYIQVFENRHRKDAYHTILRLLDCNHDGVLSDDEKARLSREGEQLQRTFQRKSQDAQDDFNEAQREIVDRIGRRMIDVLGKYSRDNGFTVILDRSGQTSPVIFAANSIDVTQEIIRLFDQSYPAKAAATTPRAPAQQQRAPAPKPATPPQQ